MSSAEQRRGERGSTGRGKGRGRGWGLPWVGILLVSGLGAAGTVRGDTDGTAAPVAEPSRRPSATLEVPPPDLFPVPAGFEPNIAFWMDVFTRWGSSQVVLHDELYIDVVHVVLDFSELEASNPRSAAVDLRRRREIEAAQHRIRTLLLDLAAGRTPADAAEGRRIQALFASVPGGAEKYVAAADRLRTQTGLADVFRGALTRSDRYLPAMEQIFERAGLPAELTRMVFVESMFQEGARSKVGAGGMWQIMPANGRRYLEVGLEMDERYDPLRATEAAASILAENYDALGSWPLAITAYNSGTNGMRRAIATLGTRDPSIVLSRHRSRTFGFASRNFYTEFLAAATVYRNRERLFPDREPGEPLRFDEFVPGQYVSARELARRAGVPVDGLAELNPAVNDEIWKGDLFFPGGRVLRVPEGRGEAFHAVYAELPADYRSDHQAGLRYRVRRGDTLSSIARRFGTSVGSIQRANGLSSAHFIREGQVILVGSKTVLGAGEGGVHVVSSGETLSRIARRYGSCIAAIQRANGLSDTDRIYPGQRLAIPADSSSC